MDRPCSVVMASLALRCPIDESRTSGVLVAVVGTKKRSADVVINFQRQSAKTGRMRRNSTNVLVLEALNDRSRRIAFHGSNQQ